MGCIIICGKVHRLMIFTSPLLGIIRPASDICAAKMRSNSKNRGIGIISTASHPTQARGLIETTKILIKIIMSWQINMVSVGPPMHPPKLNINTFKKLAADVLQQNGGFLHKLSKGIK